MRDLSFFLKRALLALIGLAASASAAQADCRIEQVGSLPVTVTDHRLLVSATINGRTAPMIVDTGAPFTVLSKAAVEALGLKPHMPVSGLRIGGIGGEAQTMVATVDSLKFGQFGLTNTSVIVAGRTERGTVGLVGRDMFGDYDVEVDVPDHLIRLLHPVGCSDAQMPYWATSTYSEAPLRPRDTELSDYKTQLLLNGRSFTVILDTGSPETTVTVGAANLAGVTLTSKGSVEANAFSGLGPHQVRSFSGLFDSIGIGDEAIRNTRIFVADLFRYNTADQTGTRFGAIEGDPTYGLVGLDFFKSHRVLISNSHHKVFFTYLGGPVFLPAPPTAPGAEQATSKP